MKSKLEENYEFFMESDLGEYGGEWVAICDNKIVAHGKNVKQVFKDASEKCKDKRPLLTKIPGKETMIF